MSANDAIYALRELLKGDDVNQHRLDAAIHFCNGLLNRGMADNEIRLTLMLLSSYATVVLTRSQTQSRKMVRTALIPALERYVTLIQSRARSGEANP